MRTTASARFFLCCLFFFTFLIKPHVSPSSPARPPSQQPPRGSHLRDQRAGNVPPVCRQAGGLDPAPFTHTHTASALSSVTLMKTRGVISLHRLYAQAPTHPDLWPGSSCFSVGRTWKEPGSAVTGYCCPLQCEEKGHEALAGASPECSSPKCKAGRGRKCPALSVPSSGVAEGHEPHPWGWLGDVGEERKQWSLCTSCGEWMPVPCSVLATGVAGVDNDRCCLRCSPEALRWASSSAVRLSWP